LKAKKQDISVRELFSRKLDNVGVEPNASVRSQLMRKLARREFIRFNPGRFNIYYLGGILVAGLAAGLLIFSNSGKSDKSDKSGNLPPVVLSADSDRTVEKGFIDIPEGTVVLKATNKSDRGSAENRTIISKTQHNEVPLRESVKNSKPETSNNQVAHILNRPLPKRNLFTDAAADNKKLKGGSVNKEALFETSASKGCAPLKVRFVNKVNEADSCYWTFGDGGFSNKKNPDWLFDVEGEYKVDLYIYGRDGSVINSSTSVTVYPKPHASFEIAPEKVVIPDEEVRFINYSTDGVSYNWDFGDGNTSEVYEPRHKYLTYNNFNVRLIVTSESGCKDSLTVFNAFSGSKYFITFPNAFIPNPEGSSGGLYSSKSDESTQVFHPYYSGVSDYQLKIFSKLGILIFESNDVNIGWDGYFKGQLSKPGVYIWKVRGNFRNGEPFIKLGDVTLLGN
jgi:hypothetical protein